MVKHYNHFFCCLLLLFLSSLAAYTQIKPIVFSEIFYDSPLEETSTANIHHNGEFIELFNPTIQSIDISGWTLKDNTSFFTFPDNSTIQARSLFVVAYQYPNSGFTLNKLFPSINNLSSTNIIYQDRIVLMNDGEEIKLYDKSNKLVDIMSYRHRSTFGKRSGYWDICASNGLNPGIGESSLESIQRINIHYSTNGVTSLSSDYTVGTPTPLKFDESGNIPYADNNIYGNEQIDTSLHVGSLPGNATISPTGAATYQIPIECPPGTNGLQPNLSISYSSQGSSGLLGLGWDIAGLSAISRTPKNMYYDGENGKTIAFDNTDCLTLDGQRLILLSKDKENFAEGAVYGTEFENYTRVKVLKNSGIRSGDPNNHNFIYFELTTKDGTTIEFGSTPGSRVTSIDKLPYFENALSWKVNRIRDIFGNSVEISYTDNGQYIYEIRYVGTSRQIVNRIVFNYYYNTSTQYNIPIKKTTINGFWLQQNKILNNITTYNDNKKVKTYTFNYLQSDRDLRLNTVATYNAANKKLTESKINWGTENSAVKLVTLDKMVDNNLNNVNNAILYSGDIDGDGYRDKVELCIEPYDKDKPLLSGFFRVILAKNNKTLLSPAFRYRHFIVGGYNRPIIKMADINLDGKDEIILCQTEDDYREPPIEEKLNGTQKYVQTFNYNQINDKIELISKSSYLENPEYYAGAYNRLNCDFVVLDENNDSFLDLIMIPSIVRNEDSFTDRYQKLQVFYGSKKGFPHKSNLLIKDIKYYSTGVLRSVTGDFNSDGKIDVIHLTYDEPFKTYYSDKNIEIIVSKIWGGSILFKKTGLNIFSQCIPLDFNNDGLTDLLIQGNKENKPKNGWFILKNNGGYNVVPTKIDLSNLHRMSNVYDGEHCVAYPIDYNGDGAIDIVLADETFKKDNKFTESNWYFYKNVNGSFIGDGTNRTYTRLSKMNAEVIDINNDGVQDLVFGSGDYYMAYTIPNASSRYRVQSITNGLGQSDRFVYTNVANPNNTASPEAVMNIHAPFTVVTSYEDKNGTITNYEYGVPKVHIKGKGFLGFETITTKTPRMGIKTITTYEINKKYYGLNLKKQEVFELTNNNLISSSSQTNAVIDGDTVVNPIEKGKAGINRFMPYISSSTTTDYKKGTSQTTTISAFDNYWNVTKQVEKMGDATKITETAYIKRNGQGVAYLPETIKVTQQRTGPDIVSQTKYELYNAAGQVGKVTIYPNTDGQVTTEYAYHPTGNLKEKKVTPKGLKTQTTTYGYDAYFRLCTSVTNPLKQVARTTYNYATGDVLTKTDINGFVTEYKYDTFGRLEKELQPNGEVITYKTEWTNSHGAVYKQTSTNTKIINNSTSYFDKYGREILTEQSGWKGNKLVSFKAYNAKGQLEKATMPHYAGEKELYTEYEYNDILGRVTKEKTFDGRQVLTTGYAYTTTTTTITPPDAAQKKTEVHDKHGLVVGRTDAGGTISYSYNAAGQPIAITSNGSKTEIEYDDYGNQKTLKDPNAGTISFTYYAGGLLKTQTNAKGDKTEMVYDDYGRVDTKTVTEKDTTKQTITKHTYVSSGNGKGQIQSIELKNQNTQIHKQKFTYNALQLTDTITDVYDGQTVVFSNTYDALWRPLNSTSPSGLITTNNYNEYGDLYRISTGTKTLWEGNEQNSKGQFTNFTLGNGLITTRSYSDRGELESIRTYLPNSTINIQNNTYTYFDKTANLQTRNDLKNGRSERFEYDELDRLTKAYLNNELKYNMTYYANGNINTKSDVGTYRYATPRPHAMSGIDNTGAGVTNQKQFIDYTPFNKVSRIRQGVDEITVNRVYDIYYGLDEQRIKTVYTENNNVKLTRYYFGSYEKEIDGDKHITNIDYIYTPTGLTLIVKNGTQYYTHTDLLGSIERITNSVGAMVSEYAYTPWGGRILLSGVNITDRGYTGHEHLSPFGDDTNSGFCLINMNGRIYDPVLARFLSPDPYVQAPDFTQSFNRYAYGWNNPFKYTDPSGEIVWFIYAGAALVGGTLNLISNWKKVDNVWSALGYFGSGALGGAVSVANPLAGGSITSGGNLITDIAGGKVPEFKNAGDVLMYTGGLALDGWGVAGVGQIGKHIGVKLAGSYLTATAATGTFAKVGGATATEAFQVAGVEFSVVSTKVGSAPAQMVLQAGKGGANAFQKHHIIPNEIYKTFKLDFKSIGWKQNDIWNLKKLPSPFHANHPAYNSYIKREILNLKALDNFNLNSMQNLQQQLRLMIGDAYRSGNTINNFFKLY